MRKAARTKALYGLLRFRDAWTVLSFDVGLLKDALGRPADSATADDMWRREGGEDAILSVTPPLSGSARRGH